MKIIYSRSAILEEILLRGNYFEYIDRKRSIQSIFYPVPTNVYGILCLLFYSLPFSGCLQVGTRFTTSTPLLEEKAASAYCTGISVSVYCLHSVSVPSYVSSTRNFCCSSLYIHEIISSRIVRPLNLVKVRSGDANNHRCQQRESLFQYFQAKRNQSQRLDLKVRQCSAQNRQRLE